MYGQQDLYRATNEFQRRLRTARREILIRALTDAGHNRSKAAKQLGLCRTFLLRMMRELEIK